MNEYIDLASAWHAALDRAALTLLASGATDVMRVIVQGVEQIEELWVDCPATVVVGGTVPGRCVYRQRLVWEGYKATVTGEWIGGAR